jgi:hypothetical protein
MCILGPDGGNIHPTHTLSGGDLRPLIFLRLSGGYCISLRLPGSVMADRLHASYKGALENHRTVSPLVTRAIPQWIP